MTSRWKSWERRLRRRLLRPRTFRGRVVDEAEDALGLPESPRILFVRFDRIGDVLVGIPVIRAVRRRYPAARITMLLSRSNCGVREALRGLADEILCYDKTVGSALRLLRALRRSPPDVAVDLVDNPSAAAQLALRWSRARRVVGLLHRSPGRYSHAVPLPDPRTTHPVERLARLLLPFGLDPSATPLDLAYPIDEASAARARALLGPRSRRRLAVNLSGRTAQRDWGRANFAALLGRLAADLPQVEPILCGLPRDQAAVAALAAEAGVRSLPAMPSFHDFAAALHECDLILTPDTAVVHLAACWKTPIVVLYHVEASRQPWLPYRTPHRALTDARGVGHIAADDVARALRELYHDVYDGA